MRDEVAGIVSAGLARGWVELGGFDGGADYWDGREGGGEDAADPPGCWVEVVHPVAPEDWEFTVWSDYTVEEVDHDEEEGEDLV